MNYYGSSPFTFQIVALLESEAEKARSPCNNPPSFRKEFLIVFKHDLSCHIISDKIAYGDEMYINRLFEIIYILLENKTVTAGKLAEHFEVSARTIYRDVEMLSAAGIPVYMSKGKGGGISLLPGFVLSKTILTENEKTDILSSLKALSKVTPDDTNSALKKLSGLFGKANTEWVEVDFTSWNDPRSKAELFHTLKSAILDKHVMTFQYASGKGETLTRQVEPLKLCFKGQAWYLYGYCRTRQDFRFFKLRRIKNLSMTDEYFDRDCPPVVISETDDPGRKLTELTLRLSKEMAFRVYDEFEDFEQTEDGAFIVRQIMPHGDWLYQYISSFGEYCEVLEPQDIRAEVATRLKKTLENYI